MFNINDLVWLDFESASALDLKAGGTLRYATDVSTRAIILVYAIGSAAPLTWHIDGAMLDWDDAPDDLRAAFVRGATFGAWNASFDCAVWNYSTLGFPFLTPERVIDPMIQAGVSNLPTDLESASRALGGAGKQKRRQEADQTILHRRRRAPRASRRMAAFSRLRTSGHRGDARRLPPDATAAA